MKLKFLSFCVVFTVILGFFSCKSENSVENTPEIFLDKTTFENLIYDINILEGDISNFNLNKDRMRDSSMSFYKGILEKYKITYKDLKENQDYYILTDQYLDISEKVLERVKLDEEKYKDLKPLKMMSLIQVKALFKGDGLLTYMEEDTISTYKEKLDSTLRFYRKNLNKLKAVNVDSLSFEVNIIKLKRGRNLFKNTPVFNSNK